MDDTGNPVDQSESTPSLRETIEAAVSEVSASDTPSESESRARDESGRFARKTETAAAPEAGSPSPTVEVEQAAASPQVSPPEDKPAEPAQQPAAAIEAPTSWNAAARDLFTKADPALREYIAKRDAEQQAGVAKLKQAYESKAAFAEVMWKQIAPYEQLLRQEGTTPDRAVASLMQTAAVLRTGSPEQKATALAQVARQYGIDIGHVAHISQTPQAGPDPAVHRVMQELEQVKATLAQQRQAEQQQKQQQFVSEIESFKSSAPHFDAVREDMAALLDSGRATTLQEAYDRAVWMNPTTRAIVQAETQAKAEAERKAAQAAQVAKAKSAAVSVTGAPGNAGSSKQAPAPTLRAELERQLAAGRA
jgi:hypothetical protein